MMELWGFHCLHCLHFEEYWPCACGSCTYCTRLYLVYSCVLRFNHVTHECYNTCTGMYACSCTTHESGINSLPLMSTKFGHENYQRVTRLSLANFSNALNWFDIYLCNWLTELVTTGNHVCPNHFCVLHIDLSWYHALLISHYRLCQINKWCTPRTRYSVSLMITS